MPKINNMYKFIFLACYSMAIIGAQACQFDNYQKIAFIATGSQEGASSGLNEGSDNGRIRDTANGTVSTTDDKSIDKSDLPVTNNPPPISTPIPDQHNRSIGDKIPITLSNYFTDADASDKLKYSHTLTYNHSQMPANSTVIATASQTEDTLTLTAVTKGSLTVTVTATDGTASVSDAFELTITNTPPTTASNIPDQSVSLGASHEVADLSLYFDDAEGKNTLFYKASSSDTSKVTTNVNGTALTLVAPLNQTASSTKITVTATDDQGKTDTQIFKANITDTAPSFESNTIANSSQLHNQNIITTIQLPTATGGNGDLTYRLNPRPLPAGMTFTASDRTLNGTPTALGVTALTYSAIDSDPNHDPSDEAQISFSFLVYPLPAGTEEPSTPEINALPQIQATIEIIKNNLVSSIPVLNILGGFSIILLLVLILISYKLIKRGESDKKDLDNLSMNVLEKIENINEIIFKISANNKNKLGDHTENLNKGDSIDQDLYSLISKKYEDIIDSFTFLQQALDNKDKEIERLKKGYDSQILRNGILGLIRVFKICDDIINVPNISEETENEVRLIVDSIEDLLDEMSVRKYSIKEGASTRSVEVFGIPPGVEWIKEATENKDEHFKVKRTLKPGFYFDSESKQVLKYPQIEVFVPGKSK